MLSVDHVLGYQLLCQQFEWNLARYNHTNMPDILGLSSLVPFIYKDQENMHSVWGLNLSLMVTGTLWSVHTRHQPMYVICITHFWTKEPTSMRKFGVRIKAPTSMRKVSFCKCIGFLAYTSCNKFLYVWPLPNAAWYFFPMSKCTFAT